MDHWLKDNFPKPLRRFLSAGTILISASLLSACYDREFSKEDQPVPSHLIAKMNNFDMEERAEIFIRIFKQDAELEVWKKTRSGTYALLMSYEICAWSGALGPKFKEGDRQAPEGFYTVSPSLMNPNSSFHLSFNLGFPNAYDRAHERTGSFLMVHGGCSSAGCYSMEDNQIEEIYALAREAFMGGQKSFQVHAFPFRMTAENMALHQDDEHMPFWRTLKRGYEHFELTSIVPKVDVCNKVYVFNAMSKNEESFEADKPCPAYEVPVDLEAAVNAEISQDRILENQIVASFASETDKRQAHLIAQLAMEKSRIAKFENRGLAYSSHMKRRLIAVENELLALGFGKDGLPLSVQDGNKGVPPLPAAQHGLLPPTNGSAAAKNHDISHPANSTIHSAS